MGLAGGCSLELIDWRPDIASKSVELEKVDETTFAPKKPDNAESLLFCPECYATFSKEEMNEAYEKEVEEEKEAEKEAAIEEAFEKEFPKKKSRFVTILNLSMLTTVVFLFGFPIVFFVFRDSVFGGVDISWAVGVYSIVFGVLVLNVFALVLILSKKRQKLFEEFKAKHI